MHQWTFYQYNSSVRSCIPTTQPDEIYCEYLQRMCQYRMQPRHQIKTNSRFSLLNLPIITLASHIPKPALVGRKRSVVPHVYEDTIQVSFTIIFLLLYRGGPTSDSDRRNPPPSTPSLRPSCHPS